MKTLNIAEALNKARQVETPLAACVDELRKVAIVLNLPPEELARLFLVEVLGR